MPGDVVVAMTFTIGVLEDERVVGLDAPALAAAVSRAMFERSDVVFVANAHASGAGAIACAAAAGADVPLLLTERDELPVVTVAELARLRASTVVLVGDESLVSRHVEMALGSVGVRVERSSDGGIERVSAVERSLEVSDVLAHDDPQRERLARSAAVAVSSFPMSTVVFVRSATGGVVFRAPHALPLPASRAIDSFAPAVVAVFQEESP